MNNDFFNKLEEFLPQYVSPLPSYAHAVAAFVVTGIVAYALSNRFGALDLNQDDSISEAERKVQEYVRVAVSTLVSLVLADLTFSVSFRLRNFRANRRHVTYSRWFPKLYK